LMKTNESKQKGAGKLDFCCWRIEIYKAWDFVNKYLQISSLTQFSLSAQIVRSFNKHCGCKSVMTSDFSPLKHHPVLQNPIIRYRQSQSRAPLQFPITQESKNDQRLQKLCFTTGLIMFQEFISSFPSRDCVMVSHTSGTAQWRIIGIVPTMTLLKHTRSFSAKRKGK